MPLNLDNLVRKRKQRLKEISDQVNLYLVDHLKRSRECADKMVSCVNDWQIDKGFASELDNKIMDSKGHTIFTDDLGATGAAITESLQQIIGVLDSSITNDSNESAEAYILAALGDESENAAKTFEALRGAFSERKKQLPIFYRRSSRSKSRSEHGALTKSLWGIVLGLYPRATLEKPRPFAKAIKHIYDDLELFSQPVSISSIERSYYNLFD